MIRGLYVILAILAASRAAEIWKQHEIDKRQATSQTDPCVDTKSNCKEYGTSVCKDYADWAKDNCQRFCGICKPKSTPTPPPCEDVKDNCPEFSTDVCTKYAPWAHDNCRRYCGFCDVSKVPTGFYGKCSYKGKSYSQGEKWDDGCDYSCECLDGASGRYKCTNKCPVYINLPTGCTLARVSGQCCLQPVCTFDQKITTSEKSSLGQTTDGTSVCVYKGRNYYQDQTWTDGCDFKCTCTDAKLGTYSCQSYCTQYSGLPTECTLEKDPAGCCQRPKCTYNTQFGSFVGYGITSGKGVTAHPTSPAPCVDTLNNCNEYGLEACPRYPGWANNNCRKFCGICGHGDPTPGPNDYCMYDGKLHKQGESWAVGDDMKCYCENAIYGYYRCVNTCPTYDNLPKECMTVKKAGQACETVKCTSGTFYTSSTNPQTIGSGGGISVVGYVPPTASTGQLMTGNGGTGMVAPHLSGCLFDGQLYAQDQQWEDKCIQVCRCTDGSRGLYTCRKRCPVYENVPSSCSLIPDPDDKCCTKPKCDASLHYTLKPVFATGTTHIGAVRPPNWSEISSHTVHVTQAIGEGSAPLPTMPAGFVPKSGGIGYCEYKGRHYLQDERWEDGCKYNCLCVDAYNGKWNCLARCKTFENLPPNVCWLIPDEVDTCCQRPFCDFYGNKTEFIGTGKVIFTTPYISLKPIAQVSTATPRPAFCEYKGKQYTTGQEWYDGCDKKCFCDDAATGYYRCTIRCPLYYNVPKNCQEVPDPTDPACCKIPHCPAPTNAPATMLPGSFTGNGSNSQQTNVIGYCLYKEVKYNEGEKWTDGCKYTCECLDADTGRYKCQDMCPRFAVLPPQCQLVTDFANPCCLKPDCDFSNYINKISGQGQLQPTCQYKLGTYYQGQTWMDGCSLSCRCEDASKGLYVCNDRCPKFESLPSQCKLVTDPADPCCQKPECHFVPSIMNISGTATPDLLPTLVPAVISGQVPTPKPGQQPTAVGFCSYKGTQYHKGDTWLDGCDFTCECLDDTTGKYKCTERCARYAGLPPQCSLMKDPGDPCCTKPVCDFTSHISGIGGQANLSNATPTPGIGTTPAPRNMCVYKGNYYATGQQWYDGCEYTCDCENGEQGIYRCTKRCPVYNNLPKECHLVPDPKDAFCCKSPTCNFNATSGSQTGFVLPTFAPGVVTGGSVVPTPNPLLSPSLGPGVSPSAGPGMTPLPKDVCVYRGREYSQGQRWQDGCLYNCECLDAKTGKYKCVEQCARYAQIPSQCSMVQDAYNPCCKKPYCDFSSHYTGISGTGIPTTTAAPAFCVYNGASFKQGETWNDGCDLVCKCEDAQANVYRCDEKCAKYQVSSDQCSMITDPNDKCCKIPFCTPALPPTLAPGVNPGNNPTPFPYPVPVAVPGVIHGQTVNKPNTNNPNNSTFCFYNNQNYKTGEKWVDGCNLNCVCDDDKTGRYTCTERCAPFTNVPAYCSLIVDPNDSCCKTPHCVPPQQLHTTLNPSPNTGVSPTPNPNVHTPQPQPSCVFNNQRYVVGQQWYDGCDKVCVCEDADTNYYRCSSRCASYPQIPPQCRMVADPKDPQCCQVPECIPTPGPSGFPTPGPGMTPTPAIVTNVPGIVTGIAPTPTPGVGQTPQPRHACVYNGREYRQGEQWKDGCKYNCVCEDEAIGKYKCEERCSSYPFVPPQCVLQRDLNDICCYNLKCDNSKPTPVPKNTPVPHTLRPGETPVPGTTPFQTPNPLNTPAPSFCVYKGVPYQQGQTWTEGCDRKCRCDDSSTNFFNCFERCPTYSGLPPGCTFVIDPKDPCCKVPKCLVSPTLAPGATPNPNPDQKPPLIPTAIPGTITGQSPNHNPLEKIGYCLYKGVKYNKGQKWDDGCSMRCECLDDNTGKYQCTERCSNYVNIPSYCILVQDPKDSCCQTPTCPGLNPLIKNSSPTPNTNITPKPVIKDTCVYNGRSYTQGQQWYDGCDKLCVCEDGKTGFYRCNDRCPKFTVIAPNCVMVPDSKDPMCCMAPECNQTNTDVPTGVLGHITGYGLPPTPKPQVTPVPGASTPTPGVTLTPTLKDVCVYKNNAYKQGQRWRDGCDFNCVCDDGVTGKYTCDDICPRFPNLPYYCQMVYDPTNPCCEKPVCQTPNPSLGPSASPSPGVTLVPSTSFCVYNGIPHRQGDKWNDGCDKTCRCEDAMTNQIDCDDRCKTYPQVAADCVIITDPNDKCCQIPSCPNTGVKTHTIKGVTGTITGQMLPPDNLNPLQKIGKCVYHGKTYHKGEKWEDGCTYDCECIDDTEGKYVCTEKCSAFPQVPSYCTMIQDPLNSCCEIPYCPTLTPPLNTLYPTPYPIGYIPYPGATPYPGPSKYPIGFTPSPGATPYLGPTPYPIGYTPYPGATPYPGPTPYPIGFVPVPGGTPYPGPTPYPVGFTPYPGATPYPGPSLYPIGYTPSPGATPYLGPTPYPIGFVPSPGATPYPGPSRWPIGFTPSPGATPYLGPTPWSIGATPWPGATPYPGPSRWPIGFTPSPGATPYLGPTPWPIGYTPSPGATPYPGIKVPTPYPIGYTPSPGATPYLGPTPYPIGYTPFPGATPYPGPSKYPIGFIPSPGATPYLGPTPYPIGYTPWPGATPYPGPSKYPIGFTPSPGATPYLGPTPYPIGFIPFPGATPYPGPSRWPIGFTPSPGATPYLGPTPYPIGYIPYPGATPYPGPSRYPIGFIPSPGATPYPGPTPYPIGYTPWVGATPYPGPTPYPIGFTPSPGATPYKLPTPWAIGQTPFPGATPYPGPSKYPIGYTPSPGATPYLGPTPYPIGYIPYPGATPYPGPTKYPIGYTPSPGATPYLGPTPYSVGYTPWPGATPYPGPSKYPIGFTPSPGATPYLGPTPYPIGFIPFPGATPYPGPSKYPIGYTPSPGATPYLGPTPWSIGYTPSAGATPYAGPSKYPIGFTPYPGATPYLGPTPYPIGFVPYPGATPYPGPSRWPIGFTPSPGATPYPGPTPYPIGYTPSPGATPYKLPTIPSTKTPTTPYPIGYTPYLGATPYPGPTPYPIGFTPSPGATPYHLPTPWPVGFTPYLGATPYPGPTKYPIGFTPSPGATPYMGPTPYPIGFIPYPGATPYPGPSKYPLYFTPSPGATPYLGPTPYPIGFTPYPGATPYPGPTKYPMWFTPSPGATPYLGPTPYPIGYTPFPGATPYPGPSRYPIGFTPSPGATPYLGPTPYPIGYTPWPGATPYPGPTRYPIGFTPSVGATPYLGPTPYPIGYTPSPGATPYLGPTPFPIGYTPYPGATPYPGPTPYPIGFTPSPGATPYKLPTPWPIGYTPYPGATPYPGPTPYPIGFTPSPGATPYKPPTPWPIGFTPFPGATPYPGPTPYPIGFTPSPGATPYMGPTPWPVGFVPFPGATPYPGPSKYPIGYTPSPGATPYLGPTPYPIGYTPSPGATPYPGPSRWPIGYTPSPGATPYLGPTPYPIGYTPWPGATPYAGPTPYPIGYTPSPGATPYLGPTPYPIGFIPFPGATPYPGPSRYPIGFTPSPGATPYPGPTPYPIGYVPFPGATPYPGPSKYPIGYTPSPGATPYLGPTPYPIGYVPWPGATPYPGPSKYPIGFVPVPGGTPYLGPTPWPIGYTPSPGATPYPGPSKYPIGYTPSPGATPYLGPTPYPIGFVPFPGATPYPGPSRYPIGFTPSPGATPYLGPTPYAIGYVPFPGATPYPGPSKYPFGFTPSPGATPYLGPTPWPIGYTPSPGATPYPGPSRWPIGYTPSPGATPYLGPTPYPIGYTPFIGATPYPGPTPIPNYTPYVGPVTVPTPKGMCMYDNQYYKQDQLWYDGCNKICRCESADTNFYRCQDRCTKYDSIQPECIMVPDSRDPSCCKRPECPIPTPAAGLTPTPGFIVTPTPGYIQGYGKPPTPAPGVSPSPGSQVTPTPSGCMYKGVLHPKGTTWEDGCEFDCICLDDMTGQYRCSRKCPAVPPLPKQCVLLPDPKNPCCQTPYCDFLNPVPFPGGIPTAAPNHTPGISPNQHTTQKPGQVSNNPDHNPTQSLGFCIYKGVVYGKGVSWMDGCDKKCVCDDPVSNYYTCNSRCPSFNNLAANCILKTDPNDPCCVVPDCNNLNFVLTPKPPVGSNFTLNPMGPSTTYSSHTGQPVYILPTGIPGFYTGTGSGGGKIPGQTGAVISGFRDVCIYKGSSYKQGEKWQDGCDFTCECMDAVRGQYRCQDRCGKYYFIPPQCQMIPDPKDTCCKIAKCDTSLFLTPSPPIYVSPYTGTGPNGGSTMTPLYSSGIITGANTPVTPAQGTGPQGSGNPVSPVTSYPGYTGNVINITPTNGGGPQGSGNPVSPVTSYPGYTGNVINITPTNGGGPQGSGNPVSPVTSYPGYTGNVINITPTNGGGPQGSGNPVSPVTSYPGYTGNVINITPTNGGGPQGSGNPVSPVTSYPGYTGSGINITPTDGGGFSGSGSTQSPATSYPQITGQSTVCIYTDGKTYSKGQQWSDGCMYSCVCNDPVTNNFRCTMRCQVYSGLPSYCSLQTDPADQCCKKPVCMFNNKQYTALPGDLFHPPVSATLNPTLMNVIPVGVHQIFSGSGVQPGQYFTTTTGGRNACYYKGSIYEQGKSWDDACSYTCTCEVGKSGLYRCTSKCPVYPALPSYCQYVTVPGQCCRSLICNVPGIDTTYNPLPQINPYPVPTQTPGQTPPTTDPQQILGPGLGSQFGGNLPGGGAPIPSGMTSVTFGYLNKCVYQNRMYNQGERWDDGCKYACECLDSRSGFYRCLPKCANYTNIALPKECSLINGACCQTPVCQKPDGSLIDPIKNPGVFPVFGTFTGGFTGFKPGYSPMTGSSGSFGGQLNACLYKNHIYKQGEKWDDGCDYSCECLDQNTGTYRCTPKCPVYTQIPPMCHLYKVQNQCCEQVSCESPTTAHPAITTRPLGMCIDKLDNCEAYGRYACNDPYKTWAHENCPVYCGFCTPDRTTPPPVCEDKINNCPMYGTQACGGIYQRWASENCRQYCGMCQGATPVVKTQPPIPTICKDKLNNCKDYGSYVCGGQYEPWARDNCADYCGYCGSSPNIHVTMTPGLYTVPPGFSGSGSHCFYKNKLYTEGQKWIDGCDYNCTCVDGKTGFYRCRDLCPTYENLPATCALVKKPGECCAKPDTSPGCGGYGTQQGNQFCYFKGQNYEQGKSWNDGCDYKCTCVDASRGFYQCQTLCLQWSLPDVCTLKPPAAGKCCPTPTCPNGYVINYPANYVAE